MFDPANPIGPQPDLPIGDVYMLPQVVAPSYRLANASGVQVDVYPDQQPPQSQYDMPPPVSSMPQDSGFARQQSL